MKLDLLTGLYVFMMAAFIGFEVIRRVSPLVAHPLDVVDERFGRDRRCGRDHSGGRRQKHTGNNLGNHRDCCGHEQYRRRLHDH